MRPESQLNAHPTKKPPRSAIIAISTLLLLSASSRADILLNEVHLDPPGSDELANLEYVWN